MQITDYHAKYLAAELTRRRADGDRLARAVAGAQVELNPHQVDAALFAFASPLAKGALLADEVGLGKTIEAGLVISQRWAEGRRRILIITPANLRKQWHQELSEKFFLPCEILETKSYKEAQKAGRSKPFEPDDHVVICSYQFARGKAEDVTFTSWDLVVIDEAHRLRNVYKPTNQIANTLKHALNGRHKLLLTATPLQNSLLELYGLVSFIDEHAFGDLKSFREQFAGSSQDRVLATLRERLRPLCHRTLRRQVTQYVPYTKRFSIVEEFEPGKDEQRLYEQVSDYLQRTDLNALPPSQRSLMTLVLRKLLASSTFAIEGALKSIAARLQSELSGGDEPAEEALAADYEALESTADEWTEEALADKPVHSARGSLEREVAELRGYAELAHSITDNAKGRALLKALAEAFKTAKSMNAAEKAIIFTESRKTQDYLLRVLADSPYADGVVLFNGTNTDEGSRAIYRAWVERHAGSDRVTGSKTADMRSALVDYFRDEGRIMIATEAGAEGINLQFCSLVVNYDLPWNPQRIEQRIGRCHRWGQKHDVVVVNFLNKKNEADQRVYTLLKEKFKLFDGVFGASDEVLGAIEVGVDFERRIAAIYQKCRHPEEIKVAFDQLQLELSVEINEAMTVTRQKLLEHFDDEVREKLKSTKQAADASINHFEQQLMRLTRHELTGAADFLGDASFRLNVVPPWALEHGTPLGLYELPRRSQDAHLYRLAHPLGEAVINRASQRTLPVAEVMFNLAAHEGKITALETFKGRSGWLSANLFSVNALDRAEDHLLLVGFTDHGETVPRDALERLWTVAGDAGAMQSAPDGVIDRLTAELDSARDTVLRKVSENNARWFEAEAEKLDGWAEDLKAGLEREIREIDRQIKESRRAALAALSLEEKVEGQRQLKALEAERSKKRRSVFDAQDAIDARRTSLIEDIEGRLEQGVKDQSLFTIRWTIT